MKNFKFQSSNLKLKILSLGLRVGMGANHEIV